MGLLQGRLTGRRFRVVGDLPDGFRDIYRQRLDDFSFCEPLTVRKEEIQGWVSIVDVTDSNFEDFNTWYVDKWICLALRVDKRVLPAKVFKATFERACREWCEEHNTKRCPASVRTELRDVLENEWLAKVMPRTQHIEMVWNIDDKIVYVSSLGDTACDRVRKIFFRTFGLKLIPFSPLEWIGNDPQMVSDILAGMPMNIGEQAEVDDNVSQEEGL